MICPQCGTNNDEGSAFCVQCGARLTPTAMQPPVGSQIAPPVAVDIPTYLVQSILATLCCCLPMGIVCIIKANGVKKLIATGDYQAAIQASNENKKILWIAFGVGLVINGLYVLTQLNR